MMFTSHFKMTEHPFSEPVSPERILQDERIEQGLARLKYLAYEGMVGLITGTTGVGKSCLVKLFLHELSRSRFQPVYVHLTHVNASSLLRLLVAGMGEEPRQRGKERLFLQILEKARATDRTTLLIMDDAHLLSSEALVDLRLLISSALDDTPRIKILLSGQETLAEQLRQSYHLDLAGRISVTYHLRTFSEEQTAQYIDRRMRKAGASEKIFEPEAKTLIHSYTGGIPRQINNRATACLLNAAAHNVQKVNESLVNEAMSDFRLP